MTDHVLGGPIVIRYDGVDADRHEIDLGQFGDSIKGLDRIISVAANFAATQRLVLHHDAMVVRVVARAPEAHCFEIVAVLQWVNQNGLATGIVSGLTVSLIGFIFARLSGNKAEMKELRGALETAIKELGNRDDSVVQRLLETVDKMADALRPAARQAIKPIGSSVASLNVRTPSSSASVSVGIAERDAINAETPPEITPEQDFTVTIHEMNMDNTSCKISLRDNPETRISASIADPVATLPNNPYLVAFAARREIIVRAKAAIRDGSVEKLYVLNTADN